MAMFAGMTPVLAAQAAPCQPPTRQALKAFGDDWVRIQDTGSHFNLAVTSTSTPL